MKKHYIDSKCNRICDRDREGNQHHPQEPVFDYAVPLGCLPLVAVGPYLVGSAFGADISCLGWGPQTSGDLAEVWFD